jgi:hypothetical protein
MRGVVGTCQLAGDASTLNREEARAVWMMDDAGTAIGADETPTVDAVETKPRRDQEAKDTGPLEDTMPRRTRNEAETRVFWYLSTSPAVRMQSERRC